MHFKKKIERSIRTQNEIGSFDKNDFNFLVVDKFKYKIC